MVIPSYLLTFPSKTFSFLADYAKGAQKLPSLATSVGQEIEGKWVVKDIHGDGKLLTYYCAAEDSTLSLFGLSSLF